MSHMAVPAPHHLTRWRPQRSAVARIPCTPAMSPLLTAWRSMPVTTDTPGMTNRSFFNLAQAHMGESAQSASAATNMPSPNAMGSSYGTVLLAQPERTSKEVLCPSRDTTRDVRKDNTTKSTYDLVGQDSRCAEC